MIGVHPVESDITHIKLNIGYIIRNSSIQICKRFDTVVDNSRTFASFGICSTMMQRVTLKDVAAHAGVARATASHVLNGRGNELRISAATQKKIWNSAQVLAYRVNVAARSTIRQSTGCLGVLAARELKFDPAWQEQLDGVNQAAIENDHYLILAAYDEVQFAEPTFMPKLLREHLVEGVLLPMSSCIQTEMESAARKYGIPTVWLMKARTEDSVYCDAVAPMHTLVKEFAAAGHKHAALLAGHDVSLYADAFNAAAKEHGLRATVVGLECAEIKERAEQRKIWELLNHAERPTALLATHGVLALRASELVLGWGLKIPADLSLVAILTELDALRFSQSMAHWSNPCKEAGKKAVEMLLKKMSGGPGVSNNTPIPSEMLTGQFVPGQSLGPLSGSIKLPHKP